VIAPDPVLLRAHGSFLTPRWREPDSNCWYYQRQPTATDAPPGILVFEDGRLPPEQQSEFALDSLLEGTGFELSVPPRRRGRFEARHMGFARLHVREKATIDHLVQDV
jgi:hypothetical protein